VTRNGGDILQQLILYSIIAKPILSKPILLQVNERHTTPQRVTPYTTSNLFQMNSNADNGGDIPFIYGVKW